MDGQASDRLRDNREFWLRLFIPTVLLVGLLILLFTSIPHRAMAAALVVAGSGLVAGGVVGAFTGVRGPHWPIYALVFTSVIVLLLSPSPWQGLALVPVPVSAGGYAIGKEIAFLRLSRRRPVAGAAP
jgi:hypothetical protein